MHKKYFDIENSYQSKYIEDFLSLYPEMENETYIIQEKLDGCNIQIIFDNGTMKIGTRNNLIDSSFYGVNIEEFMYKCYPHLIDKFMNCGNVIHLYGELYGKGIQNRVNYGEEKYLRFFDLMIDYRLVSQKELQTYLSKDDLVPIIGYSTSLSDALDVSCEELTFLNPIEDNIMEGIVIKPFNNIYVNKYDNIFMLKKKNDLFSERIKPKKEIDSTLQNWQELFAGYCNVNRIKSIYSKEGVIQKQQEIGKYMK